MKPTSVNPPLVPQKEDFAKKVGKLPPTKKSALKKPKP